MIQSILWYVFNAPLLTYIILVVILNPTGNNFIALFIAMLLQFLLHEIGQLNSTKDKLIDLYTWLKEEAGNWEIWELNNKQVFQYFSENTFREINMGVKSQLMLNNIFKNDKRFKQRDAGKPVRFLFVTSVDGNQLKSPRSYPSPYFRSYVFLNESPDKLNTIKKFLILHELAHVNLYNIWMYSKKYITFLYPIVVFIIACFSVYNYWILIALAFGLFSFAIIKIDQSGRDAEAHADLWALMHMDSLQEIKEVQKSLTLFWSKRASKKWNWKTNRKDLDKNLEENLKNKMYNFRLRLMDKFVKEAKQQKKNRALMFITIITNIHVITLLSVIAAAYYTQTINIWVVIALTLFHYFYLVLGSYRTLYDLEYDIENLLDKKLIQ